MTKQTFASLKNQKYKKRIKYPISKTAGQTQVARAYDLLIKLEQTFNYEQITKYE
jgi:flavoprotein